MKSRKKILEEEAKKDPDYKPTEELEADESMVPEEEKEQSKFPLVPVIVMGVLVLLIIGCVITLLCLGKPSA